MTCVHGRYETEEVVEVATDVGHGGRHEAAEGRVVPCYGGRRIVAEPDRGVEGRGGGGGVVF